MPINHQPWKASSSNRAVGRGATRPRSAPGNEGPLVVKRGRTCECCPHWHPATSRRVPGRRAGGRSAVLLQVFAPEHAVAVSALAGDPSPSLSTARDRRRHRLVARRRSRRPPADETNNPTPDPRLTRGMSKLVTRAASRALGTARRAGVTSRPSPRPTTAFAPSRADPRVDGGTRPTWHQHHHHPWHPRRAFRRVADPRGTAVPAPTTRSLLFPARTRPRALLSDETAREPADPSALTVPELKALLRARGQRVGGRKAELVDRVLATGGGISDRPRAYSTSTDAAPDVAAVASNSSSSLSSSPSSPSSRSSRSRSPKRPPRMRWEVSDPPPPRLGVPT